MSGLFRLVAANERRHAISWMVLRRPKTATIASSRFAPWVVTFVVYIFEQSFCLLRVRVTVCSIAQANRTCTRLALKAIGISPRSEAASAFTRSEIHYRIYPKTLLCDTVLPVRSTSHGKSCLHIFRS